MIRVVNVTVDSDAEIGSGWANITIEHDGQQIGVGGWWIDQHGKISPYEGTENWGGGAAPDCLLDGTAGMEEYSAEWWDVVEEALSAIRLEARPMLDDLLAKQAAGAKVAE
jgi:hypothetical protein